MVYTYGVNLNMKYKHEDRVRFIGIYSNRILYGQTGIVCDYKYFALIDEFIKRIFVYYSHGTTLVLFDKEPRKIESLKIVLTEDLILEE